MWPFSPFVHCVIHDENSTVTIILIVFISCISNIFHVCFDIYPLGFKILHFIYIS